MARPKKIRLIDNNGFMTKSINPIDIWDEDVKSIQVYQLELVKFLNVFKNKNNKEQSTNEWKMKIVKIMSEIKLITKWLKFKI